MAAAGNRLTQLRVSFIVGALGKGGAEKQLIYMLQALKGLGAEIQVLTLTEGQYHEQSLARLGIQPVYIRQGNQMVRLAQILKRIRAFRPHFIQATHFFTSFYAGAAGRLTGIPSIGAVRGDLHHDLKGVGRSGKLLLRLPSVLLANSNNAYENAIQMGISPSRVFVLQNVIDLEDFDRRVSKPVSVSFASDRIQAITVARLVPVKRLERFLQALAIAAKEVPALQGIIVGSGPEEEKLRETAEALGLNPNRPDGTVRFLGEQTDIPQLLGQSEIAVLTSDREGFPNVLLEAMAASVPIISTPAGEARSLVQDGQNGFLVPMTDIEALAACLVHLGQSPQVRQTLGKAGRAIVEQQYSFPRLERDLLETYRSVARQEKKAEILSLLDSRPASL